MEGSYAQTVFTGDRASDAASTLKPDLPAVRRFPTLPLAGLSCLLLAFSLRSMQDPDIGWHLQNAAHLIHGHSFIRSDAYSFTLKGTPWVDPEWLAEVFFYAGWQLASVFGLCAVMLGLLEAIFLCLFVLASRVSGNYTQALSAASVGIVLGTVSFGPRTLLFGWLCLVLELLLLQDFFLKHHAPGSLSSSKMARSGLLPLPILFAFWINLHGSWLIGMAVLLIAVLSACTSLQSGLLQNSRLPGYAQRQLWAITLLSCAALFLNPYGWHLVAYPFDLAFRQKLNVASIAEWQPTSLSSLRGRILLSLCALSVLRQLLRPRRWTLYELGLCALGLYAGLHYMRFLFLTSLLTVPLLARDLAPCGLSTKATSRVWPLSPLSRLSRDLGGSSGEPWLRGIALASVACVGFRLLQAGSHTVTMTPDFPSEKATAYLKKFHPQGRVFNDFLWGGYLEWNAPQIPVFIDSRVDIFEHAGIFAEYLDVTRLRDSLRILCKYRIRYVLFEKDTPLTYLLLHTGAWRALYQDDETLLLERTAAGSPSQLSLPDECEEPHDSPTLVHASDMAGR